MFKIYKNSDTTAAYVVELVAHSVDDIPNLPTNFAPGSTCIIPEGGIVYMLGADKVWTEVG